jgi:prephenate dehydrogenase/chorismate mutase
LGEVGRFTKTEPELAELRAEIAKTTLQIIRLVSRRNDLAHRVGRTKAMVSFPTEDEAVEASLLAEVIKECDRVGVERETGLRILNVLLADSKRIQRRLEENRAISAERGKWGRNRRLSIGVIGSSGAMGSFFAAYFLAQGHRVTGFDIKPRGRTRGMGTANSSLAAVRGADIVLVAVPIRETLAVVRQIAPVLRRNSVLVEITSVKRGIRSVAMRFLSRRGVRLLSLHPLFGPSSHPGGFKVCVVGTRRDAATARGIFPDADLIQLSSREHDRLMAYSLSLVHLLNMAFFSTLTKGIGVKGFERASTPTGSVQLALARAVLSQDPSLYSYTETANPNAAGMLSSLIDELNSLRKMVENGDVSKFERQFSALAAESSKAKLDASLASIYSRVP